MEMPAGGAAQRGPAPRKRRALALCVALLSTAGTLACLELGLRLYRGQFFGRPIPASGVRMVGDRYPGIHDSLLGYAPRPNVSGRDNPWRSLVTIDAAGVRGNGAAPAPGGPVVLAVGDSFTFGDEVDDVETWPAQLERLLGQPVVNGGVFGYGFDQIALRAEQLIERVPARVLIVSIVAEDVLRCEFSYRYAWKPYFEIADGALALRNVPVPGPDRASPGELPIRRALRVSFLADFVLRRLDPDGWLLPDQIRVHRQGVEVGRLLMDRLADLARAERLALLLMVQWAPGTSSAPARAVTERARARGVEVLEVEPVLRAEIDAGRARLDKLFRIHVKPGERPAVGHMTGAGNARVARSIAARLRAMGAASDGRPGEAEPDVEGAAALH
jgi:hypothetical protein